MNIPKLKVTHWCFFFGWLKKRTEHVEATTIGEVLSLSFVLLLSVLLYCCYSLGFCSYDCCCIRLVVICVVIVVFLGLVYIHVAVNIISHRDIFVVVVLVVV